MLIEALEERIILQLSHKDEQKRSAHTYKFETFRRHQLEITLACIQRRRTPDLTLTAGERYRQFAKNYPLFLQRVPQFVIASYLGMTSQYLSENKNKLVM